MSHEDYKEMIPAHAVSALDAADDRMLAEHLVDCEACRRELGEWQATATGLAFSAQPMEPSPQLRERILGQVRDSKLDAASSNVIHFTPPQKSIWNSFGSLGAIAAAVLFVTLLVFLFVLWRENRTTKAQLRNLSAQIQQTQEELDYKTKLLALFTKPGTRMAELSGMPIAPDATAKLAYDTSGHAMIMTHGLPVPPAGKEYQLWFIVGDKQPMPGNTFSTDSQGNGVMEDQVPAVAMNAAVFAITLEPRGGVSSPTGPMYLRSGS